MDLGTLIQQMVEDGTFATLVNDPVAQFGAVNRPLIGATLLPEQLVDAEYVREESIRYRTLIANHDSRYSPPQLKDSILTGFMESSLANSSTANQFTGQQFDVLLRILRGSNGRKPSMQAMTSIINWVETTLRRPLDVVNEKMRWDAIVDAQVIRTGDNNYYEAVNYPNPAGARFGAGGDWDNDAYDPYDDILAAMTVLTDKGYTVSRIFAGRTVISKLLNNEKIQQKVGKISVAAGTVVGLPGRLTKAQLDSLMSEDGLPPIEEYNAQWNSPTTSNYYLSRTVMVFVATTGRDVDVLTNDVNPISLVDTLGYTAIGRAQGETAPGKIVQVEAMMKRKPYNIDGASWQVSLPIIQDPEAIAVITGIN